METEKRLRMLQLFYAGVLADSIRNYSETGILNLAESKKEKEQKMDLPTPCNYFKKEIEEIIQRIPK
jgi:hypothetical protein